MRRGHDRGPAAFIFFGEMAELTLTEVARRVDVSPATLRRWVRDGIVPLDGDWTPAAVAHARIVARLRERGYRLDTLREAASSGRLAYGYLEDLFPAPARTHTLSEAAEETGLEPALIERIWATAGFPAESLEWFVEAVGETLPEEARVVKTIGDEVMVVGADPGTLVDWAVGFQTLNAGVRPAPRIGVHVGETLYRDGDYYGRAVNLAAQVGARAAGGEVLVTRPVVEAAGGHLSFEPIGDVKLKGFTEATDLFLARAS